jgi:hypothetical protein
MKFEKTILKPFCFLDSIVAGMRVCWDFTKA